MSTAPLERVSPVVELDHIAQRVWGTPPESSREEVITLEGLLNASVDYFDRSTPPDPAEASLFLQSAAQLIFQYHEQPEIVSACIRACGLLFITDLDHEFRKKRVLLHQFASPADLMYLTRIAFGRALASENPRQLVKVLNTLSYVMKDRLTMHEMPNAIRDSFDYVAGTLEYFAFLPEEISVAGDDFLPEHFLLELESRMAFYPDLNRYRVFQAD